MRKKMFELYVFCLDGDHSGYDIKLVSDGSKKVEKEVRLHAIRLQDFRYKRLLDVILKGIRLTKNFVFERNPNEIRTLTLP